MPVIDLTDVLRTDTNGVSKPKSTTRPQKSSEFYTIERATRDAAMSNGATLDEINEALDCYRNIVSVDGERDILAYVLSENLFTIFDKKLWKYIQIPELGRAPEKLSEFIEHLGTAGASKLPRSSAYRYMQVGKFLNELSVLDIRFEDLFYEEHGIDRKVVYGPDGEVDYEATREANRISRRVRYMDMATIAGLYERELITSSTARELMAKSILLPQDQFKLAVREARGENNPMSEEEIILEAGFAYHGLVIPIRDGFTQDDVVQQLKLMTASVQAGLMNDVLLQLQQREIKPIASKPTKYIVADGYKFISI